MKQSKKLVRQGEQHLFDLAAAYRACCLPACRHEGLDSDTAFACFSLDNPYVPYLGSLFQQYQENLSAFQYWGYVSLRISGSLRR